MIKIKKQINLMIIPTRNTWWIMKITGIKTAEKEQTTKLATQNKNI